MHALHAIHLDQDLEIICDAVPTIQTAVRARFIVNVQQGVNFPLVDADGGTQTGETRVRFVARFVDDVDVVVGGGGFEEDLGSVSMLVLAGVMQLGDN